MKKVLFSLGVAVLFTVLLTAPALAGLFYQSNLVCDLNSNNTFDAGDVPPAVSPYIAYTVIESDRSLFVKLLGLPVGPGPSFVANVGDHLFGQITCFDQGGFGSTPIDLGQVKPADTGGTRGRLTFRSKPVVVPTPCSDIRVDILDTFSTRICTEGF